MHRKNAVIDRNVAFVKGINITNDLDESNQTAPRYDYAVSVEGPLVEEIHASARRVWSRVALTRLGPGWSYRDSYREAYSTESRASMRSAFLVRDNIRHRRDIENEYMEAIERAQTGIILANAYFFSWIEVPACAYGCSKSRCPGDFGSTEENGLPIAALCFTINV